MSYCSLNIKQYVQPVITYGIKKIEIKKNNFNSYLKWEEWKENKI